VTGNIYSAMASSQNSPRLKIGTGDTIYGGIHINKGSASSDLLTKFRFTQIPLFKRTSFPQRQPISVDLG
jgi:hypothetical protein